MSLIETAIITEIKLRRNYHASLQTASLCQDLIIRSLPQIRAGIVRGLYSVLNHTAMPFAEWYDRRHKTEEPLCSGNLLCSKRKWHLCRDADCKQLDSAGNHPRHTCEYWTPAITSFAKEVIKS